MSDKNERETDESFPMTEDEEFEVEPHGETTESSAEEEETESIPSTEEEEFEVEPKMEVKEAYSKKYSIKKRRDASVAGFLVWSAFLVLWLFFFAVDYGIFENIGVAIASFAIMGGIIAMIWIPSGAGPDQSGWRINLSVISGVGWIAFIVIWLPFFMEEVTVYQNIGAILASILLLIAINAAAWSSFGFEMTATVTKWRPGAGFLIFLVWIVFAIYWLWFEADGYIWEKNLAVGILSFILFLALQLAVWKPVMDTQGGEVKGGVLFFAWLILLVIWFWFFGEPFNVYQNFAIVFASFLVFAGIGYLTVRKDIHELDELDWEE
jgi:hypothetical protein